MTKKQKRTKTLTVVINLDRPRFVHFGHKALKQLRRLQAKN